MRVEPPDLKSSHPGPMSLNPMETVGFLRGRVTVRTHLIGSNLRELRAK
jgi:hypothetical protein